MATVTEADEPRAGWLAVGEKGAVLGIRFLFWLATAFGRTAARFVLWWVIAYYVLVYRSVRRWSRAYLERVHGRPVRFREVFAHVLRFGQVTLDRVYLLKGRFDLFDVTSTGREHLRAVQDSGRGAIVLSAHLGGVEALRTVAADNALTLNIVGYFRNARMINSLLQSLNPEANARVIDVVPGSVDFIFTLRDRVAAGELVAILGDRVGLTDRAVEVDFLGGRARLPAGPFRLAAMLDCPMLLTFGLHTPPDRYDLHCELFADKIELPRRARDATIQRLAQRYADRLEHYCHLAPDNWFNFYDFWASPE